MEFTITAKTTGAEVSKIVDFILKQNWDKNTKARYLRRLFKLTGTSFFDKLFELNSDLLDSTALSSLGLDDYDLQIEQLSYKLVQNYNLTRETKPITTEFYYSVMGKAQYEAFDNAVSLGKHPTLTRSIRGETCPWCIRLAGTYTYPTNDMFRHHERCDCAFTVNGFKTRNGTYIGHVPGRYG